MSSKIKILTLLLALVMVIGLFAGCTKSGGGTETTPTPAQSSGNSGGNNGGGSAATPAPAQTGGEEGGKDSIYPLTEEPVTISCWWPLENNITTVMTDLSENTYFKVVCELTNVHINFVHPTVGGESEAFNLMLASEALEEMVRNFGNYYTRGLDDAIEQDYLVNLLPYMEYMPNMNALRTSSREMEVQSLTDSGYLAGLPTIYSELQGYVNGLFARKDWMDNLGFKEPDTIAEMETMLAAMRDTYCPNGPLYNNAMLSAGFEMSFNVTGHSRSPFMLKDGKVVASILQQGYKDYISTMHDWYEKKIMWQNFLSDSMFITYFNSKAELLNGEFGVTYDCFVYLDEYNDLGVGDTFKLIPIKNPIFTPGDSIHVNGMMAQSWVQQCLVGITTACQNIPLALQFWDYGYTEEGSILANYGVEGETMYFNENGDPQYLPETLNPSEPGWNFYLMQNTKMIQNAPYLRDGMREMKCASDDVKQCGIAWVEGTDGTQVLPGVTLTADEGQVRAEIMNDINTYVSENLVRFITGEKPMSDWDAFTDQIKSMNIDKVAAVYEQALVRYNNRGK